MEIQSELYPAQAELDQHVSQVMSPFPATSFVSGPAGILCRGTAWGCPACLQWLVYSSFWALLPFKLHLIRNMHACTGARYRGECTTLACLAFLVEWWRCWAGQFKDHGVLTTICNSHASLYVVHQAGVIVLITTAYLFTLFSNKM